MLQSRCLIRFPTTVIHFRNVYATTWLIWWLSRLIRLLVWIWTHFIMYNKSKNIYIYYEWLCSRACTGTLTVCACSCSVGCRCGRRTTGRVWTRQRDSCRSYITTSLTLDCYGNTFTRWLWAGATSDVRERTLPPVHEKNFFNEGALSVSNTLVPKAKYTLRNNWTKLG